MSDQVEIVAAEDAPSNTDSGEVVTPAQSTAEESEAAVTEDVTEDELLVGGPVGQILEDSDEGTDVGPMAEAEASAQNASDEQPEVAAAVAEAETPPVAEKPEVDDEPMVGGPVGQILDDSDVGAMVEPAVAASVSESEAAPVAEVAEVDDEPMVGGPVGQILEDSDEGSDVGAIVEPAVAASVSESETAPVAEVAEVDDEPMLDGPVGQILDDSDVGSIPQSASEAVTSTTATATDTETADDADGSKSGSVRILAVGQQVNGTVKRIADFGAFVDIGVGRDGLIHISELSVRRVGKVTDVLAEGQEVIAWIKKLDRDRNRISLTLIDPNTKTIRDLNKDDLVQGTVTRILPYGAFIDIGIGRDALLHVREMGVGYVAKPEDVVKVGDTIEARIIELSRRRGRVDLSLKGLREEPEPTPPPMPEFVQPQPQPQQQSNSRRRQEPEPEPRVEADDLEDLEVLSPMELAFKRAMEAEGMELNISRKKQNKRNRRDGNRSLQDEIVSRTLTSGRK